MFQPKVPEFGEQIFIYGFQYTVASISDEEGDIYEFEDFDGDDEYDKTFVVLLRPVEEENDGDWPLTDRVMKEHPESEAIFRFVTDNPEELENLNDLVNTSVDFFALAQDFAGNEEYLKLVNNNAALVEKTMEAMAFDLQEQPEE